MCDFSLVECGISSISLCGESGMNVILMIKDTGERLKAQGKRGQFYLGWSVENLSLNSIIVSKQIIDCNLCLLFTSSGKE